MLLRLKFDELQAIFDSSPIAIVVIDRNRQVLTCNQNAEKYLMQDSTDISGRKCYEVICHGQNSPDKCICHRVIQEGSTCYQPGWVVNDRYYDIIATPLRDVEENINCVVLAYVGYSVITAADGREAIQLYKEARTLQEPIDIVILDLTVPGGMGGEETLQELLKLDPEVNGIATSGYCNNPVMANYLDYGFKGVLPKPCKLEMMTQVIEDLLAK